MYFVYHESASKGMFIYAYVQHACRFCLYICLYVCMFMNMCVLWKYEFGYVCLYDYIYTCTWLMYTCGSVLMNADDCS